MNELAIYESLLFVAGDDGLSLKEMAKLTNATTDHVLVSLDKLLNEYNSRNSSALTIIETANKYKLVTKEMYSTIVSGYAQSPLMQKLSKALLETLAIIAYKQPVTRMEIEEIRGVQLATALQKLKLRDLIKEVGRLEAPGRPVLYGTTDYFLDYFGLNGLSELPELSIEDEVEETSLFFENFQQTLD
ncbi:SMC-Scp complex subunit ScpB [Marinilactibacillus psychrotolerans]|uniref:Segregation and condensation protein B n=1 Tax=Marinilactibacillus psychrotolerans TaxID=191770 RepID=A0AAV3WWC6_9LACT|nr:SMC-Scp complex subunit ScpB [Marinilactibacillus psychrotolerans]GEL67190.1 segregation and condensation protein B [Marinilactibacillus psychrotolerans]GEQ35994.1 segregation and condensation protein ScpB [Marinilactibacillus psychrotolerans]SDC58960.1 segregation and condensation protein B [Marinilactibacillus psychrotolerans]